MAKVFQQAPASLLRSSRAGTSQPAPRRGAICTVHAQTVKCESKFFTFDGDNKKASHNPYQRMVPLEETKTNNAPKLNVLEVHDTQTRKTLHHLFYAGEEKKAEVPSSCIKLAGVGVVCGSEEYLLTHAHGCIRAGGVFYSTPDDVASSNSFDITEQAWELLGGDSVLRTQDWQD